MDQAKNLAVVKREKFKLASKRNDIRSDGRSREEIARIVRERAMSSPEIQQEFSKRKLLAVKYSMCANEERIHRHYSVKVYCKFTIIISHMKSKIMRQI